jgi:hypothetical protein
MRGFNCVYITIAIGVKCYGVYQLNHGSQFYWWRKPEYPEKTINLPQVTDKLLLMTINGFTISNLILLAMI